MHLRWFVERRDDSEGWAFLDGDVPLIRQHQSPLLYTGGNEQVLELLGPAAPIRMRTGLPADASLITRACEIVQRHVAFAHSWRSVDELAALSVQDDDFVSVVAMLQKVRADRVIYWFELYGSNQ